MGDVWNSGILSANEVFEVTFPDEGDFEYFSVVHKFENMFGVVRVSDGATPVDEGVESSTWARIKLQFSVSDGEMRAHSEPSGPVTQLSADQQQLIDSELDGFFARCAAQSHRPSRIVADAVHPHRRRRPR